MVQKRTPARTGLRVLVGALVVLFIWFAVGGVGGQAIGQLSQLQKNDSVSFLPDSAESTKVAAEVEELSSDATLPLIIVAERSAGLTPADLGKARQLAADLPRTTVEVDGSRPLSEYLTSPTVIPVPSEDGKAVMLIVPFANDKVSETIDGERVLNGLTETIRTQVEEQLGTDGVSAYLTGPAGFVADLTKAFAGIDGLLLVVALGVVLVILLIVYRSPVLPFAVLLTSVFGLSAAGFVVYEVADRGWITVSGQSQGILSILVVGAATDYALLLVSRYKEELHEHESPWQALKVAWRASVEPIVASGATVILGLLALTLGELKGTAGLGPVGALGILGALLAALTLLPALLVLGRRWIFWPVIPRVDHVQRQDKLATGKGWGRVARLVGARPRTTWVVTALALAVGAAFLPTLKADGIGQSQFFLTEVDSVKGQEVLAEHFDAGSGSPLQIMVPTDKTEEVLAKLSSENDVADPYVGLTPPSPGVPPQPPKEVDGRVLVQATLQVNPDSSEALETVQRVRDDLHAIDPGVQVGGQPAQNLDTQLAADRDLLVVGPTIILVVFLVLCLLLRAIVAPLLLMVANVLSFAATVGISALVFNHVFKFPGGDPTTVLYGFVFLVALGVDYSIFLMTRAREETKKVGTRQGVLTALTVTGGVITSAGVVLAATFGALAVIPLLFLAQVAFIVAFGVLIDTLIVRSLLVPGLTVDVGRWMWWPSPLHRADPSGDPAGDRSDSSRAGTMAGSDTA